MNFATGFFNIRGAVAMSNTGADTNESAFFINQKTAETYKNEGGWEHLASQWDSIKTQLANYKDSNLLTAFIEKNGTNCYDTDSVPDSVKSCMRKTAETPILTVHTMRLTEATRYLHR